MAGNTNSTSATPVDDYRDEKGRIRKGAKQPEEIRLKNSRSQRERRARERENFPYPVEGQKQCSKCKETKLWDMEIPERSEFSPQTRVLADGTKRKYPAGRCKKCVAEDAKERKQRIANDPEWKAKRLAWEKKWRKKNRQKLRAYHRHYSAMRRRNQGAKVRGPWKKFQVVERVPREPFVEYVEGLLEDGMSILEIAYLSGVDESRLRQTVKGTYQHKGKTAKIQNVTVDVVDRVLLGTHSPLHLSDLYPELYED